MAEETGHILVVDDQRTNRLKLSLGLKQQGHTVGEAENGRQALEKLRGERFDLVLLDILMPEMDGYEVLGQMRADKVLRDVPVIVISAMDDMESVVKGIALGAEDYLPKTFDPILLQTRIGTCLEKKRLHDKETEYLQQVEVVTAAAGAVEAGNFTVESLDGIAARQDALGQLGRVFQRMAREVYAREQSLKQQLQELRIQIDEAKKAREVAEITESDYFRQLRANVSDLRKILDKK